MTATCCKRLVALALSLLAALALAQGEAAHHDELRALVAGVDAHPGVRAAEAAADAAALRADAVRAPLSVNVEITLQRLQVEPASDPLPEPFDTLFDVDAASDRASITALLRPFVAGDLRDLLDQRLIELERAELAVRETRATLEAQSVRAAVGVLLAERGRDLAADAVALSRRVLETTEVRLERGAATTFELRRAEVSLGEAERALARAERQLSSAEAALAQLVGDARLTELPELEPVLAAAPDLVRALLDLQLAEIAVRNQSRAFLPTVQAGYTWLGDDGDSLTLGIESRTLQPALTYSPGGAGAGAAPAGVNDDLLEGLVPTVRGSFNLSLSWSITPQAALERDASARQLLAAASALEAAHDRAELRLRSDRDALADAQRGVALAELERSLAGDEAAAAAERLAAGLIGPLERDQALLGLTQAELAWWTARADLLDAVLDTYAYYAVPISEVLP